MRLLFTTFLCVFVWGLSAQIGVSAHYNSMNAQDWEYPVSDFTSANTNLIGDGWSVGLDYWFRLKDARVEFFATLQYSQFDQYDQPALLSLNNESFEFIFKTNFYLLNFIDDCNCPTFSKQNNFLQKGFFLQVAPGVGWLQQHTEVFDLATNTQLNLDNTSTLFSIGIGAGVDIGLSDLITVTPIVSYRYYPSVSWEPEGNYTSPVAANTDTAIGQFQAGIRLGIRLDFNKF